MKKRARSHSKVRRMLKSGQQLVKRRRVKIHYEDVPGLGYKEHRIGQTTPKGSNRQMEANMSAKEIVNQAIKENPEIRVVLEIAARARETESNTPPTDLTPSNEVTALPNNRQLAV